MLRTAALPGGTFSVTDLAVLMRRPVSDLAHCLQEAVAAGILVGSGPDLAFRHLLIQQALYESISPVLRAALHAEAARGLAADGADALSIAQQLFESSSATPLVLGGGVAHGPPRMRPRSKALCAAVAARAERRAALAVY
jgi:hypothetical protein